LDSNLEIFVKKCLFNVHGYIRIALTARSSRFKRVEKVGRKSSGAVPGKRKFILDCDITSRRRGAAAWLHCAAARCTAPLCAGPHRTAAVVDRWAAGLGKSHSRRVLSLQALDAV
jgi:hypothetical protein